MPESANVASVGTFDYTGSLEGESKTVNLIFPYLRLMRLEKTVGSLLLLWPTLAALWMAAEGLPPLKLIAIFSLGTFLMRSAGCVINDYADRHVDGAVSRTADRPLVTGEVSPKAALILFAGIVAISGLLLLFLNLTTQILAVVGLGVAAIYPFMKRWTYLPQAALGIAFSWGIPMAWTATGNELTAQSWLYFAASVVWIVAYDTMYAMVDREDDLKVGIKSTAILFGSMDRFMIGVLHIIVVIALILLGHRLSYNHAYFVGLAAAVGLLIHQHRLISTREPAMCLAAFRNNTWVGFALFAGTVFELSIQSWTLT